MIEVAAGVTLEVLDDGGTGDAMLLIAGLGHTAHVFDDIAPRFAAKHHVYAITRRGAGASSYPDDGYDYATRVADDVKVLDALGVERAVLVGHSMGGDELTGMAATHPDRVIAVVYLDAAIDQAAQRDQIFELPPEPPMPAIPTSFASAEEARVFAVELLDIEFPMGEVISSPRSRAPRRASGSAGPTWTRRPGRRGTPPSRRGCRSSRPSASS